MSITNIQEIIEQIKQLEKQLLVEMQKKEKDFFYKILGKKVFFDEATRKYHKTLVKSLHTYILNASLLNILTAPIIWSCLLPACFMDLVISIYHAICFPVYGIPKVRRSDYIVIDRHALSYLNIIEKINCIYCGYFNGLIAYTLEIAARTEQYWCPIKHARRVSYLHSRYKYFLEYGDSKGYKTKLEEIRKEFDKIT